VCLAASYEWIKGSLSGISVGVSSLEDMVLACIPMQRSYINSVRSDVVANRINQFQNKIDLDDVDWQIQKQHELILLNSDTDRMITVKEWAYTDKMKCIPYDLPALYKGHYETIKNKSNAGTFGKIEAEFIQSITKKLPEIGLQKKFGMMVFTKNHAMALYYDANRPAGYEAEFYDPNTGTFNCNDILFLLMWVASEYKQQYLKDELQYGMIVFHGRPRTNFWDARRRPTAPIKTDWAYKTKGPAKLPK
jgi:hypothetical protein